MLKRALAGRHFTVPILSGVGRGLRWPHTSQGVHAYWLGTYENHVQAALAGHLRKGGSFCDIGAQCGFFSLLASRLQGREGAVLSVEANPSNCAVIEQVRALNPHPGWQVLNTACAAASSPQHFYFRDPFTSSLLGQNAADTERTLIPGLTLPEILDRMSGSIWVKMDIEGGEAGIFSSLDAGQLPHGVSFLVEIHGQAALEAIQSFADRSGYCLANPFGPSGSAPRSWGMHSLVPQERRDA